MFSPRNNDSPNSFPPAIQYLRSNTSRSKHRASSSSGSIDSESDTSRSRMYNPKSSTEFRDGSIPLISLSRSPSPYLRRQSGSNPPSETDDDDWEDQQTLRQPFLSQEPRNITGWKPFFQGGGFGQFLFTTQRGWSLYVGVLVFWLGGCEIGVIIMNRIILWSAYLKNNYTIPLTPS
jgi:hypothetical protein